MAHSGDRGAAEEPCPARLYPNPPNGRGFKPNQRPFQAPGKLGPPTGAQPAHRPTATLKAGSIGFPFEIEDRWRGMQPRSRERPAGRQESTYENPHQQSGMIRSRPGAPIVAAHRRQGQPLDHFDDKTRQMSLRKPLVQRRQQKISGLSINLAEIAQQPFQRKAESMRRFYQTPISALSPTGCYDQTSSCTHSK